MPTTIQALLQRAQAILDECAQHSPDDDAYWVDLCMTPRAAAARLGISHHTITTWFQRGTLDVVDEESLANHVSVRLCYLPAVAAVVVQHTRRKPGTWRGRPRHPASAPAKRVVTC